MPRWVTASVVAVAWCGAVGCGTFDDVSGLTPKDAGLDGDDPAPDASPSMEPDAGPAPDAEPDANPEPDASPVMEPEQAPLFDIDCPRDDVECIEELSAGLGNHTCARDRAGDAHCWGDNFQGQIGHGVRVDKSPDPVDVEGMERAEKLSVGQSFTCFINNAREILCAGQNGAFELGDPGRFVDGVSAFDSTVLLPGDAAIEVEAGWNHACAILEDTGRDKIFCWGDNGFGQLGPNNVPGAVAREVPLPESAGVPVKLVLTQATSCVLTDNSQVWCWGSNAAGLLGREVGGFTEGCVPQVQCINTPCDPCPGRIDRLNEVQQLSLGFQHGCAVVGEMDRQVFCWGDNSSLQLGRPLGGQALPQEPGLVESLTAQPVEVAAGGSHTCVRTDGDRVLCWGSNTEGQAGQIPTEGFSEFPQEVFGLSGVKQLSAGLIHNCALLEESEGVSCWGGNFENQVGPSNNDKVPSPLSLGPDVAGAVIVDAGLSHSCAMLGDGEVKCWGSNFFGELGIADPLSVPSPARTAPAGFVRAIAAGGGHTCGAGDEDEVKCWGSGREGALGAGRGSVFSSVPAPLSRPIQARSLSSGAIHSCAVDREGAVLCWGEGAFGRLGDGTENDRFDPTEVLTGARQVSAGGDHTCAVDLEGGLWCWGLNDRRQLGVATAGDCFGGVFCALEPVQVEIAAVRGVAVGLNHTCALTQMGEVFCWGDNEGGKLGDGSETQSATPRKVQDLDGEMAWVATGGAHTCAVSADGDVFCWGINSSNQLGFEEDEPGSGRQLTPKRVARLAKPAVQVVAGMFHTCALHSDGAVTCWGGNNVGQRGRGDFEEDPDLSTIIPAP